MAETTQDFRERAEKTQMVLKAKVIRRLVQKGLKADWSERDLLGFLSVMASLNRQVKDWKWPSIDLYMVLDPKSLATLVFVLEERRKKQ